jgi:hypothetical protein
MGPSSTSEPPSASKSKTPGEVTPGASRPAVIIVVVGWFASALSDLPGIAIELDGRFAASRLLPTVGLILSANACAALAVGWTWLGLSGRGGQRIARVAAMIAAVASAMEMVVLQLVLWKVPAPFLFARWSLLVFGCTSLAATFAWTGRRSALFVVLAALGIMTVIVLNVIGALQTFGRSGWLIYTAVEILIQILLGFAALGISRHGTGTPPVAAHPPRAV